VTGLAIHSFISFCLPATAEFHFVLQPNTEKVTVQKKNIESIVPSKKSAMPEGLFNTLSQEEIADLFAYLSRPPSAK
jgi:hypothetical protein